MCWVLLRGSDAGLTQWQQLPGDGDDDDNHIAQHCSRNDAVDRCVAWPLLKKAVRQVSENACVGWKEAPGAAEFA